MVMPTYRKIKIIAFERERIVMRALPTRCPVCQTETVLFDGPRGTARLQLPMTRTSSLGLVFTALLIYIIARMIGAGKKALASFEVTRSGGKPVKSEASRGVVRLVLLLACTVCIVAVTVFRVAHSGVRHGVSLTAADLERQRQLLLDGVGASVSLLSDRAEPGQVQASIDSVRTFIHDRSGLDLDPEVTARLAAMEQRTLDGNASRVSPDDLSDSVLAVVVERFRHSTDTQIEDAADRLGNVRTVSQNGGKVPASAERVMMRADGRGLMSRSEFVEAAKQYRARMNVPVQLMAIVGIARPLVRQAFQTRLAALSQGLPEQWGGSDTRGLTPARAFLLSYSVIADDSLYRSNAGLHTSMRRIEQTNRAADSTYPASAGRLPYGSHGYLFSAPVHLILDKQTSLRLLDKLTERM
ncbi:MAG TPA: hypothetical protein VN345_14795 [Blastocatellia bacterium]|nr:hypothetical protein [Blastocatellia bacterium]